jgi:hypothetical protein
MNPWLRRLGYLLVILVWLILMSLPLFSFVLAARNQLQIGSSEGNHIRIFLVQEKDAEGLGLEIKRLDSINPGCAETSVRYFMWTGRPANVTFCQCVDLETGHALSTTQAECSS